MTKPVDETTNDEILEFSDALADRVEAPDDEPYEVLLVDDDDEVHRSTRFAIAGLTLLGRRIQLLHAMSAADAVRMLEAHPDTAVALVDVVMEREQAGLELVSVIRNRLKLADLRIIIRTGQPGFAPEADVVTRFDINDYYSKAELTQSRLISALTLAIRSYDQLREISAARRGIEALAKMAPYTLNLDSSETFMVAVVQQLRELVPTATNVAVVTSWPSEKATECRVIAGTGRLAAAVRRPMVDFLDDEGKLAFAMTVTNGVVHEGRFRRIIPLSLSSGTTAYLYFETSRRIRASEARVIDVLSIAAGSVMTNIEARLRLDLAAYVDSSTALATRTAIERELLRDPHPSDTIAIVELDRIVDASDALGQRAGDTLLREAAGRLEESIDGISLIARIGPATLACLLRKAHVTVEELEEVFEQPLEVSDLELRVPPRIGIATRALADEAQVDPLAAAGLAHSAAKRTGGRHGRTFEVVMASDTRTRLARVGELRRAIEIGELELHFQPQIDLATLRVVGSEALVRWRKSSGELVPPLLFIDLAEQSGLIVPIGEWVLREACKRSAEWKQLGLGDLKVAVNVSVEQFHQIDFPQTVARAIDAFGIEPSRLELELTESVGLTDFELARSIMQTVVSTGVNWALDDFGIGYSSLSYLRQLPVSRLKIDRAFTTGIRSATEGVAIPKLILELAKSLDMDVTAEGVETEAVAMILRDFGCTEAQGYHFARPLPAEEFVRFVSQRNGSGAVPRPSNGIASGKSSRVA